MFSFISEKSKTKIMTFIINTYGSNFIKNIVYRILIVPSESIALYRLKKLVRDLKDTKVKKNGKKIIFNSVDARYTKVTYNSITFAKALQMRGHNVKMLLCNNVLKSCAGHFTMDKKPSKWECSNCKFFSNQIYKTLNIPFSTYDEYITKDEIKSIEKTVSSLSLQECENHVYKTVKTGLNARVSAIRYLKGDSSSKEYEKTLRMELVNSIISAELASKVYEKEKPDIILSSHTCYSSWGSFVEYFANKNKKIGIHSWGGTGEIVTLDEGKIDENFRQYFDIYRKKSYLDKSEEKKLQDFLDKRFKGETDQVALYEFTNKKSEEIENTFHFEKYERTYVIFPNVPWDASLLNADKAFDNVYDWVRYTIELFKNKPNMQLIIKIHPSELRVMGSKTTVLDYINKNFKELPENIYIIPPNTDISPYSLFKYIDVGLVYNGTLGIEMSVSGITVIVAGITHYGGKGFAHSVSTKKEYENILFGTLRKPTEIEIKSAKLYAYYYFLDRAVPFRLLYYNSFLDLGLNFKSLAELEEGKNKYADLICNYIVNGGVYQDWKIKDTGIHF